MSTSTVSPGLRRLVFWSGIAMLCAWIIVPIYLIALGAFGGRAGVFRWPKNLLPLDATFSAMQTFLAVEGVWTAALNGAFVACLTMLFSLLLGAPAGYALARYSFTGQNAFRMLVVLTRAFPLAILALPLTVTFIRTGLYDTAIGVALVHTCPPLCSTCYLKPFHGHPERTRRSRLGFWLHEIPSFSKGRPASRLARPCGSSDFCIRHFLE
jgi:ABC-type glycerol-3-phosphate transport system permease component